MKKPVVLIFCFILAASIFGCAGTKEVVKEGELDRTMKPEPGPTPVLILPEIQNFELSNGLPVKLVEHHELPIAVIRLVINTGSYSDPSDKAGLASLTADMLDEGTESRTALEIADAVDFIGASLGTGSSQDGSYISLSTLTKHLDTAVEIFADVSRKPSFPEEDLEKLRERRITSIIQRKDQPASMASIAFNKIVYGESHPYGTPSSGTEESIKAITRDELLNFFHVYYKPNNAAMVVVGDVTQEEITPVLEAHFGSWKRGDIPPSEDHAVPELKERTIYLVDKPNAAQSYIYIGHSSISRSDTNYIRARVMNSILGGQFTSRINLNLREDKGYTYGARSSFSTYRNGGSFVARAGVKTAVTDSSLFQFLYELRRIRDDKVNDEELSFSKKYIIRGMPADFETPSQIAGTLNTLILNDLPDDYYSNYVQSVDVVSKKEIINTAKKLIDPDGFVIVIVGDIEKIKRGLESLDEGPVVVLDEEVLPE